MATRPGSQNRQKVEISGICHFPGVKMNFDVSGADWTVIDVGNACVHLMMPEIRQKYDIEMLWAVGPQFDDLTLAKSDAEQLEEEFDDFRRQIEAQRLAESAKLNVFSSFLMYIYRN